MLYYQDLDAFPALHWSCLESLDQAAHSYRWQMVIFVRFRAKISVEQALTPCHHASSTCLGPSLIRLAEATEAIDRSGPPSRSNQGTIATRRITQRTQSSEVWQLSHSRSILATTRFPGARAPHAVASLHWPPCNSRQPHKAVLCIAEFASFDVASSPVVRNASTPRRIMK